MIAGVFKRQTEEAKTIGADQVIATDNDNAFSNLPPLDAVADTVDGSTAEKLLANVKPGGVFASVLGPEECGKVSICEGGAGVRCTECGGVEVHGRSRAKWQAGHSDKSQAAAQQGRARGKLPQKRAGSGKCCWWPEVLAECENGESK